MIVSERAEERSSLLLSTNLDATLLRCQSEPNARGRGLANFGRDTEAMQGLEKFLRLRNFQDEPFHRSGRRRVGRRMKRIGAPLDEEGRERWWGVEVK